ncbi:MAG: 5-methylcytosine restriction system specificity protein McrC, partial [Gemmatimonadaceae bacterium]
MDQSAPALKIPIQNVYYLLSYAWNRLEASQIVDVESLPSTELVDLFAHVLSKGLAHVLRRGLDRGYVSHEETIPGIRGKMLLTATLKRNDFLAGRTVCAFDELSYDVLPNQLIKATIRQLLRVTALDRATHAMLADLHRRLGVVSEVVVRADLFRRVQLHRNNAFYGFLLDVCYLIHEGLLVDEESGAVQFRDFIRDPNQMPYLFQYFVFNFLKREQSDSRVSSEQLRWHGADGTEEAMGYLPAMQTDIVLSSARRRVIIDTKFYAEAFQRQHKATVRSDHLYHLYAYMRTLNAGEAAGMQVEGMLLSPAIG